MADENIQDHPLIQSYIEATGIAGLGLSSRLAAPAEFMDVTALKQRYFGAIKAQLAAVVPAAGRNQPTYADLLLKVAQEYPLQIDMVIPSHRGPWFSGNNHEQRLACAVIELLDEMAVAGGAVGGARQNPHINWPQPAPVAHPYIHNPNAPYVGGNMTLTVKNLKGEAITVQITSDETIDDLKNKIEAQMNIPAANQRLMWDGKQLMGEKTLSAYRIDDGSLLFVVVRNE